MKRQALKIEHRIKERLVGVHTLDEKSSVTTLGSSRTAHIRLLGEEVAGLHAAIDCNEGQWTLSDLGGKFGTWIQKNPVVEHTITERTVIHIGQHELTVVPHSLDASLFAKPIDETKGAHIYHQVVVLKKGKVHHSLLLAPKETFTSDISGSLRAPTSHEWVTTESGDWTIKQRLTRTDLALGVDSTRRGDGRPTPIVAAFLMMALVIGVLLLMPKSPDDEMKTLTPDLQNQYTRMIFDGQKVRKQKAIAEKMRKNIEGQTQTGVAKSTSGGDTGAKVAGGKRATPGAKVVMNLKNAGLGALIGRVAARASKTAQLVESAGVAADSRSAGRALGLGGGSAVDKLGGGGGGTGTTMKVAGVGTAGKGGGSSGYKGTGALSQGNVGNAEVGVLEEETEVDGGLDREAIARVIRSQLGQIRYCYERQLSANPDLYGKIMVKFTIGAAGAVVAQTIGTTSLNNAMVEGCILRRIAGWQFPNPKGGTNVLVTYPFLFKSTR